MTTSLQLLFAICIISVVVVTIMSVICKRDDASIVTIILQGSFIFRNLNKYIKPQYILPIRIVSYIGIISFLIAILEILLQGF